MKNQNLKKILILFVCSFLFSMLTHIFSSMISKISKNDIIQTIAVFASLAPILIFPVFAIFAVKPIWKFTESYFRRFVIFTAFAFFPIIFTFILILILILMGDFHPIIGL